VALVATVLLWRIRRKDRELLGLVSGLALPVLYVAYLNRDGPGTVCRTGRDGSQACIDEWSPWPWLVVGALTTSGGRCGIRGSGPRQSVSASRCF
jgi:hypothetical protein